MSTFAGKGTPIRDLVSLIQRHGPFSNLARRFRARRSGSSRGTRRSRAFKSVKTLIKRSREVKVLTSLFNNSPDIAGGFVNHITVVAQGDSVSERIGRIIHPISLSLIVSVLLDAANANLTSVIRFAVIVDMQQVSDTDPNITEVYESSTDPLTFRELDSRGRFRVLWTEDVVLDKTQLKRVVFRKTLTRLPQSIFYNGVAVTDIQKNGLYFMVTSTDPALEPTIVTVHTRLRFTDA